MYLFFDHRSSAYVATDDLDHRVAFSFFLSLPEFISFSPVLQLSHLMRHSFCYSNRSQKQVDTIFFLLVSCVYYDLQRAASSDKNEVHNIFVLTVQTPTMPMLISFLGLVSVHAHIDTRMGHAHNFERLFIPERDVKIKFL